jgi:hypothetical protein
MTMKLNKYAYQNLIAENTEWLLKQPRTLERDHIEVVLKASIDLLYPVQSPPAQPITHPDREAIKAARHKMLVVRSRLGGFAAGSWECSLQRDAADACELLDAALAGQADAPPKRWKLVPIEPTDDMEIAGGAGIIQASHNLQVARYAYRAMIKAAPQPPQSREPGEAERWLPIETAPREGLILVCIENSGLYPWVSRWLAGSEKWTTPFNKEINPPTHWQYVPDTKGSIKCEMLSQNKVAPAPLYVAQGEDNP